MNIEIVLGVTSERNAAPAPAVMDVEELLATRLLVQGNSGSGKSHLLRRLLEQSAPHVQQVIVDPEGDFVSLADAFGHVVVGANRSEAELVAIANRIRARRVSCVLDLSMLEVDNQMRAAAYFMNALFDAPRELWYPALVVVDEAQLFAPSQSGDVAEDARKASLGAMTNLMCRGRKRGLAGVIATQRLAKLAKNVAAEASNFLMGRTFLDIDMARAADLLGVDRNRAEMFRELPRGSFVALGPALSRKPLPIQVGDVTTRALGSTPKLTPPPTATDDEVAEIILAPVERTNGRILVPKPTPVEAVPTDDVLAQVESREEAASDTELPPLPSMSSAEAEAERELALRNVVAEVLSDQGPAASEAELYQGFTVHCRIRKLGKPAPLDGFRKYLEAARSGASPERAASERWRHVEAVAGGISPDLRVGYFLLANAAMDGAPCPSDADFARAYGSGSAKRGRSKFEGLERLGFLLVRKDMRGNRSVSLLDIECETAFGDPEGAGLVPA